MDRERAGGGGRRGERMRDRSRERVDGEKIIFVVVVVVVVVVVLRVMIIYYL